MEKLSKAGLDDQIFEEALEQLRKARKNPRKKRGRTKKGR